MHHYCQRVPNFILFRSTIARFPDNCGVLFHHMVQWSIGKFPKKKKMFKPLAQNFKIPQRSFMRAIPGKSRTSLKTLAAVCRSSNFEIFTAIGFDVSENERKKKL